MIGTESLPVVKVANYKNETFIVSFKHKFVCQALSGTLLIGQLSLCYVSHLYVAESRVSSFISVNCVRS